MSGRGRVLVTGASRGIGREIAIALARTGHDLVLWARSRDDLGETAELARGHGAAVVEQAVDVGDRDQVEAGIRSCATGSEALTGLVLNAGAGVWRPLAEVPAPEWSAALRTNLDGAFHVLQAALPTLRRAAHPLVVGVLSDSAVHPFPDRAAYSAAKAGTLALLEVARREHRAAGLRISLVLPSRVDTHFSGSHADARPGTRAGALSARDVAQVVDGLFALPPHVEVREIRLAATTSTYGPYPERVPA
ncbi:SDR family oxidoreductase [Saccharopolyspora sp. NPDC050642]|uniref:SDR family oxidoreductase n=1 Tax=Saccharopolyspora sp. NPDC050642 TaxID=3157099 RepID=UPI0033EBDFEA